MSWTAEDSRYCTVTVPQGGRLQMLTARRWKQQDAARRGPTLSWLAGDGGTARLVVLVAEVGGRWSTETAQFLSALAKARALSVPQVLPGRVEAAWIRRWSAILVAVRPGHFLCPCWTSAEVLRDDRFTWERVSSLVGGSVASVEDRFQPFSRKKKRLEAKRPCVNAVVNTADWRMTHGQPQKV